MRGWALGVVAVATFAACSHSSTVATRPLPRASAVFSAVLGSRSTPCRRGYVAAEDHRCYKLGTVLFRPADVVDKAAFLDPNRPPVWAVSMDFTPAAAMRFRQYAAAHPHQQFALVAEGRVVLVSRMPDMPSRGVVINGDYTKAQAERIANSLGGRDISRSITRPPLPAGFPNTPTEMPSTTVRVAP